MKKILLSLMLMISFGFITRLQAQCDLAISNLSINITSATPYVDPTYGNQCKIVFNASFDIQTNSGFKYLFFHTWLLADYPNPAIFNCQGSTPAVDPGTSAQLGTAVNQPGKSFLDIGFINLNSLTFPTGTPVNVTSKFASTFLHDASVILTTPSNSTGLSAVVTRTSASILHFDITNITVYINQSCAAPITVKADIWGSNSNANDPKAQCYICGLAQSYNDPAITGFKVCSDPRTYNLGIATNNPNNVDITYKVYIDKDGSGTINAGDELAFTSGTITISSSSPYSVTGATYPYSPNSDGNYDLIIKVEGATLSNSVEAVFEEPTSCIPLPVKFKVFNANRSTSSSVSITWTTASEQNSKGFNVQRNVGGVWTTVAFVPSQALNGTSTADLTYSYTDVNNEKGVTQYRVQQVDLDGKFAYTDIRAIRGEGTVGKVIVYPNPSADGKVNVVFEDNSTLRDVQVSDMQGKVIKLYKGITNNILVVERLTSGFYTIKITNRNTAASSVEKVVVK